MTTPYLYVRCLEDEKATIERAAGLAGVSANKWLLEVGLAAAREALAGQVRVRPSGGTGRSAKRRRPGP